MKIGNPIKNFIPRSYPNGSITQYFGENVELYNKLTPLLTAGHNGIDIVAPWGTPIYAVEDGIVVEVKDTPTGYGKYIRILNQAETPWREWVYCHNSDNLVKVGDIITSGQHIANMGNTGFVVSGPTPYWAYNPYAGTHLHLGLRYAVHGDWQYNPNTPKLQVLNYNNGTCGSADFLHMFDTSTQNKTETLLSLRSALNTLLILLRLK